MAMNILGVIFLFIFVVALAAVPMAWLIMLALGNFGFPQFGLIDCLPAGLVVASIGSSGSSHK